MRKEVPAQSGQHLVGLTPLRGFAALFVATYHYTLDTGLEGYTFFFINGYLWVDFFFVLSGFIMMHVYGAEFRERVHPSGYRGFIVARLARIYPVHFVLLITFIVAQVTVLYLQDGVDYVTFIDENSYNLFSVLTNLLLIHAWNLHDALTWNGVSWSISAEFAAYLVFPFICAFLDTRGYVVKTAAGCIGVLGVAYVLSVDETVDTTYHLGVIRCLSSFLVGMLIYYLYRARVLQDILGHDRCLAVLVGTGALALHLDWPKVGIWLLMCLLILSTCFNQGLFHAALKQRYAVKVGELSYSVYMVHTMIFNLVFLTCGFVLGTSLYAAPPPPFGILVYPVAMALVLLAAVAMHRFVEVPCRDLLRRGRGRRVPAV